MARRFFMNDFEQSLKEHADEFKMVPSKRVWHGIYNDIHPGRRWPSVTMSIVLIFILVVVGHLNTHNGTQLFNVRNKILGLNNNIANHKKANEASNSNSKNVKHIVSKYNFKGEKDIPIESPFLSSTSPTIGETTSLNKTAITSQSLPENSQNKSNLNSSSIATSSTSTSLNSSDKVIISAEQNANAAVIPGNNKIGNEILNQNVTEKTFVNNAEIIPPLTDELTSPAQVVNSKIIIENESTSKIPLEVAKPATTNKKILKPARKRNDNINWVYYVAPEISSVSFKGAAIKENITAGFSPTVAINQRDNKVLYNSALGFEAGVQMDYAIGKKLRLTTGVHFTYSGYNIISNEVHPTFATLILRDPSNGSNYSRSFITHYGDGSGQTPVLLRSYSFQVSLPVGFQYQLKSFDKFQINTAANFEPSLVLSSNSFVLSSDGRNYINDVSLLRKANISSNFGAFVSFTSWKLNWQIGPNLRYQWLSSYHKDYTVKEHLIDYGIRIGISK